MSSARLTNFRRVLAAALGTRYYRPWLERASLHTPEQIAALASIKQGLEKLPTLEPHIFLADRDQFRNSAASPPTSPRFFYPHQRVPRTAVLMEGFRSARRVRVLPNGFGWKLAWFRPEALAGPLSSLDAVAAALECGELRIPPLTHAVIVLTRIDQPPLSDADRDRLWQSYQVPVYQQLLGFSAELLAWECEAHQGLHIVPDAVVFESRPIQRESRLVATSLVDLSHPVLRLVTGWRGNVVNGLCGCGQAGERLSLAPDGPALTAQRGHSQTAQETAPAVLC